MIPCWKEKSLVRGICRAWTYPSKAGFYLNEILNHGELYDPHHHHCFLLSSHCTCIHNYRTKYTCISIQVYEDKIRIFHLVLPNSNHRDIFFYPYQALMKDSYKLICKNSLSHWTKHLRSTSFSGEILRCAGLIEPGHEKTCLMSYANNKGADQPAHPRSLISAFVIRCLDSVMSLVSVTKISSLMLASVAEQAIESDLVGNSRRYVFSWRGSIWICKPVQFLLCMKRPRGRAVSAPDFGSRGRGFESRWRRDSSRT